MSYENQCGSCEYFKDMRSDDDRYYDQNYYELGHCVWYRSCYYPDDTCNHYSLRSDSSSSGCYLTTIICNRLGLQDHCMDLEVLRNFRDNFLQKNKNYASLLYEYDVVGPKISSYLEKEEMPIIQKLFDSYIKPISEMIQNEKFEQAINRYVLMTNSLKDCYGISVDYSSFGDYDSSLGGHGVFQKKIVQ